MGDNNELIIHHNSNERAPKKDQQPSSKKLPKESPKKEKKNSTMADDKKKPKSAPSGVDDILRKMAEENNLPPTPRRQDATRDQGIKRDYKNDAEDPGNRTTPTSRPGGSKGRRGPVRIKEPTGTPLHTPRVDCSKIRKDVHYIFTFGEFGSAKTTVNGMVTMLLHRLYESVSDPVGNPVGVETMNRIQDSLLKGEFPATSSPGEVVEYVTSIRVEDQFINLVFLEMSGEDLEKIENGEDKGKKLENFILPYLQCPDAKITFMLVADYNRVVRNQDTTSKRRHTDFLFHTFISYLRRVKNTSGKDILIDRLLLVLSKCDQHEGDLDYVNVVKRHLPMTANILRNPDVSYAKVFPFEVGDVEQDENGVDYISALDLQGPVQAIAEYMIDMFYVPPKQTIWNRFVDIMRS